MSETIDDILETKSKSKIPKGHKKNLKEILFSFKGRINRSEFWRAFPILFIYSLINSVIMALEIESSGEPVISILLYLIFLWPSLAVATKRLHDRNRSGWLLLTWMIPYLNIIFIIWLTIEIWFLKGTEGDNRFGPDPCRL